MSQSTVMQHIRPSQATQLIPTFTGTLNNQPQPLVNARDLHEFLGVGKDFATWIKQRIADYDFIEGVEFSPILGKTSKGLFGGRPKTEYHLSLDMAKELSMVERNDKGRQARRYFIACEKQQTQPIIQVLKLTQQNEALQQELLKSRPQWADIIRYKQLQLTSTEIGKLINRSSSTVTAYIRTMKKLGFNVANNPQPKQLALALVHAQALENKAV
ncbi:antA/AntB antirepressor family protein [Psychrobacter sp. HD31]|uniref:antA/AntB antirepressor family protein n=1 Tax=Psychrobacter sp. HD31 TaxID=3112003 RepID=UPI003DA56E0C